MPGRYTLPMPIHAPTRDAGGSIEHYWPDGGEFGSDPEEVSDGLWPPAPVLRMFLVDELHQGGVGFILG